MRHLSVSRRPAALAALLVALILAIAGPSSQGEAQSALSRAETEEVRIPAGDVELGATLYRPAGAQGDLPIIVTAHGSAPSTREGVGFYTNIGLELGYAVLSFDKRGTGVSTGEYERFTVTGSRNVFPALAADLAWATRWVAVQEGIDASRIGYLGGSQAGWIMPLATDLLNQADDPEVDFVIIGEGTPLSANAEAVHAGLVEQVEARGDALSSLDIAQADAVLATTGPADGYDPSELMTRYDVPTLWIFGLNDPVIPIQPSIDYLAELIAAGRTGHSVHVLAHGDHNFANTVTGERYDLLAIVRPWLDEVGR